MHLPGLPISFRIPVKIALERQKWLVNKGTIFLVGYHVMLRGNNGHSIFFQDSERCHFCLLLQEGVERFGHKIHAFCLMSNHIHLLIEIEHTSLSQIIQNVAFRYTRFINKKYKKIGHLFQGRFKSILLQEETYFLRLLRYIHMNPVKANLVNDPLEYFWSSHSSYLGKEDFSWVTTKHGLKKFSDFSDEALKKYSAYLLKKDYVEGIEKFQSGSHGVQALGDEEFIKTISEEKERGLPSPFNPLVSPGVVVDAACDLYSIEKNELCSSHVSRQLSLVRGAIAVVAKENGLSLEAISRVLGKEGSALSKLAKRFREKCITSPDLQEQGRKLATAVDQLAKRQA